MDDWIIWILAIQLAFAAFLIWVATHYRTKRLQQRAEERGRFLDRFENPRELAEFLDSEAGRKLLGALSGRKSPATVISTLVTVGILLLCGGLGLCGASYLQVMDLREELLLPGVLALLGGVGILVSAAFTAWMYQRTGRWTSDDAE